MRKFILILNIAIVYNSYSQEYFIPIKIKYFLAHKYAIPYDQSKYNYDLSKYEDIWINAMNYPLTNPKDSRDLYKKDRTAYETRVKKILFTRDSCKSLVEDYVFRASTKVEKRKKISPGLYVEEANSGDKTYFRCVCLPVNELIDIPHIDHISMGDPAKYFKPVPFVKKFQRFGLDSLDLREAPYFTIFPMDILPSFNCAKATTPVEKAICRNAELAQLDRKLMDAYKEAIRKKGESLKASQRKWVKSRDAMLEGKNNEEITKLLFSMYFKRIEELNSKD